MTDEHDVDECAHRGFHNHTTPCYDEKAAELAWQRTVEFIDRHLKIDG